MSTIEEEGETMRTSANRMFVAILFCVGLISLGGCATRLGDFTVLSTKNVDVTGLKPGDRFSGEDCVGYLFAMIPLGDVNWKNAMDQALERGKGDVMVDVVLTAKGWMIPYIFGQQCIEIEGTVSQTSSYRR
jgi:hypothetical protein